MAAHDPSGSSKTLACAVDGESGSLSFSVGAVPPHAGVPLTTLPSNTLAVDWPIVVGRLNPDTAEEGGWFDAAMIYRSFVLSEADWTRQGPLSKRTDVPRWSQNLTVWVNSHWQGNDVFNVSGGAPSVVEELVSNIVRRFGLEKETMGLHWYEWDTLGYTPGSNYTQCDTEITCGFDTHYPEYFPSREGFNASLRRIQVDSGVRVTPYVNGRIFDQATKPWHDFGRLAAAKNVPTPILSPTKDDLVTYNESYGSKAEFAVMCPHTEYWQTTMSNVVGTLTNQYGTDGVYVDQVAAAGPRPCWDPSHNHTLGGGNHWTTGYVEMLRSMRSQAGDDKLLLTESNAEPFMGQLDMYLTLVGFGGGDLSPPPPTSKKNKISSKISGGQHLKTTYLVPAFQSVYGGYVLFMGAEFFQEDLTPEPDVFAAKIANQLLFGAQLGWFSLGGRLNLPQPAALYDLLMDSKYDEEIEYLRLLSHVKRRCAEWLTHGRAMRSLALSINGTSHFSHLTRRTYPMHPRSSRADDYGDDGHDQVDSIASNLPKVGVSFDAVMSAAWMSADETSLLIIVTTVERGTPATAKGTIDVVDFGFVGGAEEQFDVYEIPSQGTGNETHVGTYPGNDVSFEALLGVRSVLLFRVTKTSFKKKL